MPYLSQLLDSKIKDSADAVVGKLKDILVVSKQGQYVPLKFLVVQLKKHKKLSYVPYDFVENFSNKEITFNTLLRKIPARDSVPGHYLFLKRDVLDQQIVDMAGVRVVRVNDLRIGNFEGEMCVLGIDISTKGLMRRIGVEWLDFFDVLDVNLIDWRQMQPLHGGLKLDTISKNLNRLHPADLANIVEDLSVRHGEKLVTSLDAESAAKVLEEVDPNLQRILLKHLEPEEVSRIFSEMSLEEVVDLIKMMPKGDARELLSYLKGSRLKKVQKLIKYDDDTAGGLMMVEFVGVRPNWTVGKVIDNIRKAAETIRSVLYVYVTDEDGVFLGAVSLRWLLISPRNKKISELVKNFPEGSTLRVDQSVEEIMEVMTKYDLYTAAVIDKGKKLVGVVTIDDIMRHLVPNA